MLVFFCDNKFLKNSISPSTTIAEQFYFFRRNFILLECRKENSIYHKTSYHINQLFLNSHPKCFLSFRLILSFHHLKYMYMLDLCTRVFVTIYHTHAQKKGTWIQKKNMWWRFASESEIQFNIFFLVFIPFCLSNRRIHKNLLNSISPLTVKLSKKKNEEFSLLNYIFESHEQNKKERKILIHQPGNQ